ncbi:MAG: endolytic transglycosylase MltG [Saprospiraceae bacterium]|nr:endolytic transglycosylase MltG [Saprospiraceae bacterium]MBK8632907.1 endolytic transglycosylase MltG [Saprospiraceae bacterium]MBP7641923.1 endolytic transglycosylase MltG [Saprospiraceae bacterium]
MRKLFYVLLAVVALVLLIGGYFYKSVFAVNTNSSDSKEIFIPTGSSYDDVVAILKEGQVLKDYVAFDQVATWMKYKKDEVPAGHYVINPDQTNKSIVRMLRAGEQAPMKLTINNVRTLAELAGAISKYIETDSLMILNVLRDPTIQSKYNKNSETMMTAFLPDTYEVFWTTKPEKVIEKLADHTNNFWEKNAGKLAKHGLTTEEAYTMASIVDKESNLAAEKATVAGVYLNRIKTGMKLQADPTVVFAMQDFTLRRVLLKHLEYDSPYNTYMYAGLPPGPICMPSMSSLNAVINAEDHDYIFFCAKPGYNAGHLFASNLTDHNQNAQTYQKWLASEGIF